MDTEVGCGTAGHDPACLCDVVIVRPLPPLRECMRDVVQDLDMGPQVAELRGYGIPWTNDSMLDFLCDVQKFWDAWKLQRNNADYTTLEAVPPIVWDTSRYLQDLWREVREAVMYAMNRWDASLMDILAQLHVSAQRFMDAVTNGHNTGVWDDPRLIRLESMFMEPNLNFAHIARTMEMSEEQVDGLRKYWAQRRERLIGSDNPARDYMHKLAHSDLMPSVIVKMVEAEHGVKYSRASVSKYRERLKNKSQGLSNRGRPLPKIGQ